MEREHGRECIGAHCDDAVEADEEGTVSETPNTIATESVTTGPWKWFDYPDGRKLLVGHERAVIHCPDAPMAVSDADQRLIAAAPDLRDALKSILDQFEEGGFVRNTDSDGLSDWAIKALKPLRALADARAALDKVDGQTVSGKP